MLQADESPLQYCRETLPLTCGPLNHGARRSVAPSPSAVLQRNRFRMTLAAASLFLPHISRNLVSTSNSVTTDQSHTKPVSPRTLHLFGAPFPLPERENLGHSLYFSYSHQLSRFTLSRASFYLELKEGTSSLFCVLILIGGC